MQRRAPPRQRQQQHQVIPHQRLRLENRLHERDVDERELGEEGDGDGGEEHAVLGERAAEAAVLQGGDEVEEDEAREGLEHRKRDQSCLGGWEGEGERKYHGLLSTGHMIVREREGIDEQCPHHDDRSREQHSEQDPLTDDRLVLLTWWLAHHRAVHRIDA